MPKDNKSTKVKIPSKAPENGAGSSAIKKGISDDFTVRSTRRDSEDIDAGLDAAGVVDAPETDSGTVDSNKEIEAGTPPPVVGEGKAPEAGTPPPVAKEEPATPPAKDSKAPVVDPKKGASLKDPDAEKKSAEAAKSAAATPPAVASTPPADPKAQGEKDEELAKVEQPKNISPAAKENWDKLSTLAKERGAKLKEATQRYEQAVVDINKLFKERGKLPEDIEKELTDHRQFRKLHDIENDAEFKKQYADRITDNDKQIESLLLANGMSQAELDTVKAKGFMAMPKAFWDERVHGPLEKAGSPEEVRASAVIKSLLEKNHVINHEKLLEVKKAAEGKSEYWNQREAVKVKEQADEKTFVEKEINNLQEKYPFLKIAEIPANATPEQKEEIQKANQYVGFLHQKAAEHFNPKTVNDRLNTMVAAVYAYIAEDQFVQLQQRYKAESAEWQSKHAALESQLEEIKKASITSDAGGSTPANLKASDPVTRIGMKNIDAIEAGLMEAEAGAR